MPHIIAPTRKNFAALIRFIPLSFAVARCSLQTTQASLQLWAICQHRVFDGVEAALPSIQFEALRFREESYP